MNFVFAQNMDMSLRFLQLKSSRVAAITMTDLHNKYKINTQIPETEYKILACRAEHIIGSNAT